MLLKNVGFEQYQNINDLYLYKINLNDPQNRSKIESTDITSTPQQIEFQNKHWPKLYKKLNISTIKSSLKKNRNIRIN